MAKSKNSWGRLYLTDAYHHVLWVQQVSYFFVRELRFLWPVISNRTRKRGKAQHDGRPPLIDRRQTFVAICRNEISLRATTGVGWGPVWMIPLHCSTSETPTTVQESGTDLLHKPSYRQFLLPRQQRSVGGQFEWHRETGRPRKPPVWYNNLGHIFCTGRDIANFVFKYPNFR